MHLLPGTSSMTACTSQHAFRLIALIGNSRDTVINEASDLRVDRDDDGALVRLDDGLGDS
ncbi:MAG: hypothetical protein ACR2NT_09710 [Acidimicrobiia bacterium]|nr:DUF3999 domain-containing protein [Actinomycetota bacterium]